MDGPVSIPEHRHADGRVVDPRLWLVTAFVLGVVLTAAVAVALGRGSSEPSTQPSRASDGGGSGARASTSARPSGPGSAPSSPSSSPTSSPSPGADVQHGLMTQPLAQLQRGDRVVYQMSECRFRSWVVRLDVALIACPGEAPFQVRTAYLVPVEPGGD